MVVAYGSRVLAALLTAAFVLSHFGRLHFMLDNLSSFKVHFALAFLVLGVAFLSTRQHYWLALMAVGLLASLASIAAWYWPAEANPAGSAKRQLRVMSVNVSTRLRDGGRLVSIVNREQPDILGLIEVTPNLMADLDELRHGYAYRVEVPHPAYRGMALWSRYPLNDTQLIEFGDDIAPTIRATADVGGAEIALFLVHPHPPMTARRAGLRNRHLGELAARVNGRAEPVIVLGDLNVALWSPYYRSFEDKTGLLNARRGHSVAGTWPPTATLGAAIDHILHSDGLAAADFRVLPRFGSDHLPVLADLALETQ